MSRRQLEMFPGEAPAPPTRSSGLSAELAEAHRARGSKHSNQRKRRDGRSEIFCPSCGSRISVDLARALAT